MGCDITNFAFTDLGIENNGHASFSPSQPFVVGTPSKRGYGLHLNGKVEGATFNNFALLEIVERNRGFLLKKESETSFLIKVPQFESKISEWTIYPPTSTDVVKSIRFCGKDTDADLGKGEMKWMILHIMAGLSYLTFVEKRISAQALPDGVKQILASMVCAKAPYKDHQFKSEKEVYEYSDWCYDVLPTFFDPEGCSPIFDNPQEEIILAGSPFFLAFNSNALSFPSKRIQIKFTEEAKKVSNSPKAKKDSRFEKIKKGDFKVPYQWDEESSQHIPALSELDSYYPIAAFYDELELIKERCNDVLDRIKENPSMRLSDCPEGTWTNLLMMGRPATGKTSMAKALAAALQMPLYTIPLNKEQGEGAFLGETKVVDSKLQFTRSPFMNAFTKGGIVVLEEINFSDPNIAMGCLGSAIEPPFLALENGYMEARRHPLCVVIGTMNVGVQGSKPLTPALVSRFNEPLALDDPSDEEFAGIMGLKGFDEVNVTLILSQYKKFLSVLQEQGDGTAELYLTMRGCINALTAVGRGEVFSSAVQKYLATPIKAYSEDVYKNLCEVISMSYK